MNTAMNTAMNKEDKQYCISILKRARDTQGSEFPSKPWFDLCLEIAKAKAVSVREVPSMKTVVCQGKTGVFMFSLPDCSFRFSSSEDSDTEAEDRFWEEVMDEACSDHERVVTKSYDGRLPRYTVNEVITAEEACDIQMKDGYHPAGYGFYGFKVEGGCSTWVRGNTCD